MAFTSFQGPDFSFETVSLASLAEWARQEIGAGRVPCAYLRAQWCGANVQLEKSLVDEQMARALRGVSAAVVDIDAGVDAVMEAGFDARSVPVFFILGVDGRPTGAKITGAAWQENTPENMAPPLGRFFDGPRGEVRLAPRAAAYAAPAAVAAASEPSRSRIGALLMVVLSLGLIGFAAWLKVSSEEADRKEKADAEQKARIGKAVDASIQQALQKK